MDRFWDATTRWLIRVTIKHACIDYAPIVGPNLTSGELEVRSSKGGTLMLEFAHMYQLDEDEVLDDRHSDFLEFLEVCWPEGVNEPVNHKFGDGLSLCDASEVLHGHQYGLGLFQFGQMQGWWELVYDEHSKCPHQDKGKCGEYCTLYIDKCQQPPNHPKKRKEKRVRAKSKFRLSDLFPDRGIIIPVGA